MGCQDHPHLPWSCECPDLQSTGSPRIHSWLGLPPTFQGGSMGRQLGIDPLTAVTLKPPPKSSLQTNIPTYPVSVFSEMPEGSRGKGVRDTPLEPTWPWETFSMQQTQSSYHPWTSVPAGEGSLLTFSKTFQSPLPEESPDTGGIRKQQKTSNSKQHRQQGHLWGSCGVEVTT